MESYIFFFFVQLNRYEVINKKSFPWLPAERVINSRERETTSTTTTQKKKGENWKIDYSQENESAAHI